MSLNAPNRTCNNVTVISIHYLSNGLFYVQTNVSIESSLLLFEINNLYYIIHLFYTIYEKYLMIELI